MIVVEPCLHCQITDLLARAEKEKTVRRANMTELGRFLDERLEAAYREAEGQLLHRTFYGDFYAPAGGPNAFVGFERQATSMCTCGRQS